MPDWLWDLQVLAIIGFIVFVVVSFEAIAIGNRILNELRQIRSALGDTDSFPRS